jgi:SOS response regulatory protein OraA/RecX
MPRLTEIRELERDRVALELDGRPWRIVPTSAVARAGLWVGVELDRERLRDLRRALHASVAIDVAMHTLARRDAARAEIAGRLSRRGVAPQTQAETLERLSSLGAIDDARFAAARARQLAERGYGDAAIAHDLEARGVDAEAARGALATLADESARATAIIERDGLSPKSLARLGRRGFSETVVEELAERLA